MKRILGLDLGTTSIGWAYVLEGENDEKSEIKQIGVRVNPLTVDEQSNFEKGKPFSLNADRTLKRGARRNLDRYKLRRKNLIELLKQSNIINNDSILTETGAASTHSTWKLRAKAATEKVELDEFARILLAINKKRGYKSSRKAKNEEEGQLIDGMAVAKILYNENLTPGQLVFQNLKKGSKLIPDFYRSDLQNEFDKIWEFQKSYHPEILTDEFYKALQGKGMKATSALFWTTYQFNTADIKDLEDSLKNEKTVNLSLREKKRLQAYKWRNDALTYHLEKEQVAYVLTEINNNLNNSSGYLGTISDRSKELYFNHQTVGQYLYEQLKANFHTRLKSQVFYRQDYLDEFEKIWETQAKFYPQLTKELKAEIRDVIIFYQRRLKSQKGLISFCELESKEFVLFKNGKKIVKISGSRVAPKSSPLFQEFKIWQNLSNVLRRPKGRKRGKSTDKQEYLLSTDDKKALFEELNLKGNISAKNVLEFLNLSPKDYEINYTKLEGNRTNQALYNAFLQIIDLEGYDSKSLLKVKSNKDEIDLSDITIPASEIKEIIQSIFESLNINTSILNFNAELDGDAFEQQSSYLLWHLLYSYEGDNSSSGNERLYELLEQKFGFKREHAKILSNIPLQDDYGNLSTKAMRNIYPYIKENMYSVACELAGYRHSKHSLTKEELENRTLKAKLDLLPKNSLRQPVVEKILNQMINVVNTLIDKENSQLEKEGKPRDFHFDEIRIELARELKKNAKERKELNASVNSGKSRHDKIIKILQSEFGIKNPSRNDIIRYRLYEELKWNDYKDLYKNMYIPKEKLFSKEIDIEHIIPKSKMFNDSFSNKTIVYKSDNLAKSDRTAYDYIESVGTEDDLNEYLKRIEYGYALGSKSKDSEEGISKAKYRNLLKRENEIGEGFIERDLRETQYIAKKAKEILFEITHSVVSTSGSITDRLREDWGLISIMKEINLPKYRALGLTEQIERKGGNTIEVISDWTKRNDHRHHAMDALTIAFTKRSFIQYLNNLNARRNDANGDSISNSKENVAIDTSRLKLSSRDVLGIEAKETIKKYDDNGNYKRVFKEPIENFRQIAKEHLESILISHKAKNKVVTKNKNKIRGKATPQETLTPRGQLHKETVYGSYHYYETQLTKVNGNFDAQTIEKVTNPIYRAALQKRLEEFDNDPKKAFAGKNALAKNPIYLNADKTASVPEEVKLEKLVQDYSIRKDVTPENFKDLKTIEKIVDQGIKRIMLKRLNDFGGDPKKAFSDLENNPIWLNEKKKVIPIKRVSISGVNNAEALHYKKDHFGNFILDANGNKQPVDFVNTGNNHHVAIYRDANGNLQENVVSFYEAVARVNQGLPIIDKTFHQKDGWQFLFTMKQNELFVFPNEKTGFNPAEIDLLDPKNKKIISPNLFRVQKFSTKDYVFRHHLETNVENRNELKDVKWKRLGPSSLDNIIKIRTNHLGDIISIGEY